MKAKAKAKAKTPQSRLSGVATLSVPGAFVVGALALAGCVQTVGAGPNGSVDVQIVLPEKAKEVIRQHCPEIAAGQVGLPFLSALLEQKGIKIPDYALTTVSGGISVLSSVCAEQVTPAQAENAVKRHGIAHRAHKRRA